MAHGQLFFDTYLAGAFPATIVDLGAQDVNGSLRQVAPANARYLGLDLVAGPGVDLVISDPYQLPLEEASADAVVSSSCFEHVEMFWLTFNELLRVLRPGGLLYLNVPANGEFHRYPVDCWRFYPDAGPALVRWGQRSGFRPALLESFTGVQQADIWSDQVCVFVKDEAQVAAHPRRMLDRLEHFTNGRVWGNPAFLRPAEAPEDLARLRQLTGRRVPAG